MSFGTRRPSATMGGIVCRQRPAVAGVLTMFIILVAAACGSTGETATPAGSDDIATSDLTADGPTTPAASVFSDETATLVGAGDIATCNTTADEDTAELVAGIDGTVITLGDNAYPDGSAEQFAECYDPTWGRFKKRTRPVPGDNDYHSNRASPYFEYFGTNARPEGTSWYTFLAGTWRVYALDSACSEIGGCGVGSPQYQWLENQLSQAEQCMLAYWHAPRFSSATDGDGSVMADITKLLYDHGAEVILAGDDHYYERFAPLDPEGNIDETRGIRHFVVGTGGARLDEVGGDPLPQSEVRDGSTHGVIKLELRPGGYEWEFLPTETNGFADSGADDCH